ncbi:hypothetical protein B0H16DRAFT_1497209 [Mycena metata]|uniref:Gfd2/YDR514C-like C-terminal domain-containing protein n=1 Tax=Mycena metata TaxID=1033252 RepID=A0AAD7NYF7_9AGAR|nr:hypothetical protein B0H16DRAFT_1497209 [Mycena metata]
MTVETPIVTGYYRPEVLPACDRDPLKGVLAHDALVHRENPLHPGVHGVTMFLGTFHTGEQRLLFSSAQIDYVRYWLHAMKLTSGIIPLPYSDCLLTPSEFSNVSPIEYKEGGDLRVAVKTIEKNNKRLKGSTPSLLARRDTFERVRKYWSTKTGTWCSIDFEAWERDHSAITEFGYSSLHWDDGAAVEASGHFTVKEHAMYTNGTYVPENRKNYLFGKSVEVPRNTLKTKVSDLVTSMGTRGPLFLVFHDPSQDIKYLKSLEAPVDAAVFELPPATPTEGIFIIDTAILFAALVGDDKKTSGLEQVCHQLQIQTEFLHNAGNDAQYTMFALREMASGDPVDLQREKRWPNRIGTGGPNAGVKVQFTPYEEDADFSDQEGLMGIYDPRTGVLRESE